MSPLEDFKSSASANSTNARWIDLPDLEVERKIGIKKQVCKPTGTVPEVRYNFLMGIQCLKQGITV